MKEGVQAETSEPRRTDPKVESVAALKAEPFGLEDVRLLDGPFKRAMDLNRQYLMSLDVDRLLHNFRVTAGLPSAAEPLGGWEAQKCELRGHFVGHYLSACALTYAAAGDEQLKARADAIVAGLAKCQEAMPKQGFNKGYLSAYPESFFDRVDACKPVWAPYYTLHKIMAGLLDARVHCGNSQALDVLEKMAEWLLIRVNRLSREQMQKALGNEHGGMSEVLADLYAVTGNPKHLELARSFCHEIVLDPLARGEDRLNGLHANTQIPKITGAARLYELTGEQRFRDIAEFFWRRVALSRSYVIGGHSDNEHFFPVEGFSLHLGPATAETCNTYNMLKLTRHLFQWSPSVETMDFHERALYNHILASQDPQSGMVIYFASLEPGHFKTYSTPGDSFWCCVGTGIENHARYADAIYFHDADSLFVNLFISSELTWRGKGLVVRQETGFPEEQATRLTFRCDKPLKLSVKIRCPSWVAGNRPLVVNNAEQIVVKERGACVTLDREWKNGDTVMIPLPMSLRAEALPGASNTVALLYGPIALAGELGVEGLENVNFQAHRQGDLFNVPTPAVPALVSDSVGSLLGNIEAVAGAPLTFKTVGAGKPHDVTLIPFYKTHRQRYTVYWNLFSPEDWKNREAEMAEAEAKRADIARRLVDEVRPGDFESEKAHKLQGDKTEHGSFSGRQWRHAVGGWFCYEMKVAPNEPVSLICAYWGGDTGNRRFDVIAEGEKIAEQSLDNNKPGEFFDVEMPLPESLTKGKKRATIRFQAHPGNIAGGVFGCKVVRARKEERK